MRIVLYQPDIPQNLGAIMRLCVCLDAELHVIEPAAFPLDDKKIKLKSLDYGDELAVHKHASFSRFEAHRQAAGGRLVLLSTGGEASLYETELDAGDWLLFGRESGGVPDTVFRAADLTVTIPMGAAGRSLNVGMAAAMALSEARRQKAALTMQQRLIA